MKRQEWEFMLSTKRAVSLILFFFMLAPVTVFSGQKKPWSVSPLFGFHSPSLDDLYNKEFKATLSSTGEIKNLPGDEPFFQNIILENELPIIDLGANSGIEFTRDLLKQHKLILGLGSWNAASIGNVDLSLPFQGRIVPVSFERKGTVSYNEYYLGWRYDLDDIKGKIKYYTRLSLHEYIDINYKEDLVFRFSLKPNLNLPSSDENPVTVVTRSLIMTTQATGVLMFQFGTGAEYQVTDWLSFGVEGSYIFGFRKFRLTNFQLKSDFINSDSTTESIPNSDNLTIELPLREGLDGNVQYLDLESSNEDLYEDFELAFDGWKVLFKASVYF